MFVIILFINETSLRNPYWTENVETTTKKTENILIVNGIMLKYYVLLKSCILEILKNWAENWKKTNNFPIINFPNKFPPQER